MKRVLLKHLQKIKERSLNQTGFAIPIIMAVIAVATILGFGAVFLATSETALTGREKVSKAALHAAEAGVNDYVWHLNHDPEYYSQHTHPAETDWKTVEGGSYKLSITQPEEGSTSIIIESTGRDIKNSVTRKIRVEASLPTFASFYRVVDDDVGWGSGATTWGKIHSNGNVSHNGTAKKLVQATGSVSGSGTFEEGYEEGVDPIDFNAVVVNLGNMEIRAQQNGIYYADNSPNAGYLVELNSDGTITISEVLSGDNDTNITTSLIGTQSIPDNKIFYSENSVWVKGTLNGAMTIATENKVYTHDDINYVSDSDANALGLICIDEWVVPSYCPSNLEISAAILVQNGNWRVYGSSGSKDVLTFTGSIATRSGGSATVFSTRYYYYNEYFEKKPPPWFPTITTEGFQTSSWEELSPLD